MILNPIGWLKLEFQRVLTRKMLDNQRNERIKSKRERKRQDENRKHIVYYFHQVDDPYSHLCSQILESLDGSYDIELKILLVPEPTNEAAPEPLLLKTHSFEDAKAIAPFFNLEFNPEIKMPNTEIIRLAQWVLISNENKSIKILKEVSDLLWSNNKLGLEIMATGVLNEGAIESTLAINCKLRKKNGHYLGGVFAYEGECYWGIDRLPLLEKRLTELGASKSEGNLIIKKISSGHTDIKDFGLEIDVLWSARSPYSYLVMKPLSELSKKYHLKINYRIILPMVMRGMKVSFEKRIYITRDCKRIADERNIPFGNIVDPLGLAVERCYSLFDYVKKHNKEKEYLQAFAESVWAKGLHGYMKKNLKNIIESIDLNWKDAKNELDSVGWKKEVELNREKLFSLGKWGPPTMILKNNEGDEIMTVWGQDRIWLLEEHIKMMQIENN